MPKNISENQHYVPQFILRNFQNSKGKIFVIDKHLNNIFETNVKNIAVERNFNEFNFEGENFTLEPSFCELEGRVSKIVNNIIHKNSLRRLIWKDKIHLSNFIIVQYLRTNGHKERIKDFGEKLSQSLIEWGIDSNEVAADQDNNQLIFVRNLVNAHKFVPYLLDKDWVLLETTVKHPYYISDNPVTLQNQKITPGRGNLGFAVEGIEIYLPISKTLTLALWCSSYNKMMTEGYKKAKGMIHEYKTKKRLGINIDGQFEKNKARLAKIALKNARKVLKALETGNHLKSLPENV
ncbi:DUF4238 domain-containing protein [archaeon]|nr:DUF4238 domain-containing protein [archaeon]